MDRLLTRLYRRSVWGPGGAESGMAMLLSLSVAFIVFTIGAVWLGIGTHQVMATGRDKLRDQARSAAEAGINAAMSGLSADANFTGLPLTAVAGGGRPSGDGGQQAQSGAPASEILVSQTRGTLVGDRDLGHNAKIGEPAGKRHSTSRRRAAILLA